jgi:NAD(P)-dependent dehydrogenase (short-subunit alcohol dehydrogenase family)
MRSAIIIGASGGIGGALEEALRDEGAYDEVRGFARSRPGAGHLDLENEATIAAAADRVANGPPVGLLLIATGLLHEGAHGPEKAMRELDPVWLARSYAINAIGPALVLKHFLPLLATTGTPVAAALTARVGSLADNRLGGWHGYRAAKAALNMILRGAAVEARRRYDRSIVVGLHPGTVDTPLSRPFQGKVAPGSLFKPDRAAMQLLDVIDGLKPVDSGKVFGWDGAEVPF